MFAGVFCVTKRHANQFRKVDVQKTIFISDWLNSVIRNSAWVQVRHVPLSAGRQLFVSRNIHKCRVIIKPGDRDREDKKLPKKTSLITSNKAAASTTRVAKLHGQTVICIRHYSLAWQSSKVRFSIQIYIAVSHKISNHRLRGLAFQMKWYKI